MKKITLLLLWIVGLSLHAQIDQRIYSNGFATIDAISDIDSIVFNAAGDEMEVIYTFGFSDFHALNSIDSVVFIGNICNDSPHTCGAPCVHNPTLNYGSMTDQEGNVYKTIVIDTQEWMAENLKTSVYRNGDAIATNLSLAEWGDLNSQTGAWVNFFEDSQYDCPYGKLYNWYAAVDSRNLCPSGWHVPSDDEWSALINFLDPTADGGTNINVAGKEMKSVDAQYWPNGVASTNASGFSGLPGGIRSGGGFNGFMFLGSETSWWSTTAFDELNSWNRRLALFEDSAERYFRGKRDGFSVRCVRD